MADGVDIDLYSDDIDPNFQMKVKCSISLLFLFGVVNSANLSYTGSASMCDERRFARWLVWFIEMYGAHCRH